VRPRDLAPDDADLGALDGLLGAVDVCGVLVLGCSVRSPIVPTCYALASIPPRGLGAVNALELEQRA
jgi:hypothetical protein